MLSHLFLELEGKLFLKTVPKHRQKLKDKKHHGTPLCEHQKWEDLFSIYWIVLVSRFPA